MKIRKVDTYMIILQAGIVPLLLKRNTSKEQRV